MRLLFMTKKSWSAFHSNSLYVPDIFHQLANELSVSLMPREAKPSQTCRISEDFGHVSRSGWTKFGEGDSASHRDNHHHA